MREERTFRMQVFLCSECLFCALLHNKIRSLHNIAIYYEIKGDERRNKRLYTLQRSTETDFR